MTKISRLLTAAAMAGALLTGTAFAQSASNGAMSSMSHGHMASDTSMSHAHGQMSSGAMSSGDHMKTKHMKASHMKASHMKASHMKTSKHGKKKGHHMTSGAAMTSGH